MESSRIFIKGLPPTFTEAEFKKHFSQTCALTDSKIFPNRRIGYVGYKTPEDARKAVKYFNKTFIRMSRIGVELARPPVEGRERNQDGGQGAPTARQRSNEGGVNVSNSALKDGGEKSEQQNPKLKEFLEVMGPKSKKRAWEDDTPKVVDEDAMMSTGAENAAVAAGASDDEYETVPRPTKKLKKDASVAITEIELDGEGDTPMAAGDGVKDVRVVEEVPAPSNGEQQGGVSDADWARSRTSRLLGLLDDDEAADAGDVSKDRNTADSEEEEEEEVETNEGAMQTLPSAKEINTDPAPPIDSKDMDIAEGTVDADIAAVRTSMRLFVRNLSYKVIKEDLEAEFEPFGQVEEIHVPLDVKSNTAKGFAYIQFSDSDAAETALRERDGQTFQGRLMHILPASKKREIQLDEFELSKLPLKKQQQIKKRREAASTTFNWNALYMNADAVVSSVANKLGLAKSEVLDPTDSTAAIKQAHAETHIIQETKAYFREHGIELDAFKKSQRGDTGILVKNIPYDCSRDELRRLFEEHGKLKNFLMPPSETLAIIEYANAAQCKAAFGALAYRKLKSSVLFLEKAPVGLFDGEVGAANGSKGTAGAAKTSAADVKEIDDTGDIGTATVFVRNLNFTTTSATLTDAFKGSEGFHSARVKTKTDPKKPGQILSMGFGFLEFRSAQQAQSAIASMDNHTLEGHKLQLRASHKATDATATKKRSAGRKTKVVIKNLPFEATKKEVRTLFGAYGTLRSVRVPKKMDRAARGFAFADFTTPKEAESAIDALKDTHLLGRRLVLDFAEEEPEDPEVVIARMQEKVGSQINKEALQKAVGGGKRKKFNAQGDEEA